MRSYIPAQADAAPLFDSTELDSQSARAAFAQDLLSGLKRTPRTVPAKYFYDAAGSALFDQICELPEYYPTRTELKILADFAPQMAAQIGPDAELIEFGAGSLTKVRLLLDAFETINAPTCYLPIDISGEHLENAAQRLRTLYPRLNVKPVVADYMQPMSLPATESPRGRRVGFFPGSTIGNMEPDEALSFLHSAAEMLRGGGLLIGVDLVKDPARLHAAYNDAQGVTAAFNLNMLRRANLELDASFNPAGFNHYAYYNPILQRIEMHLISKRDQTVSVMGQRFSFREGETIHTENSHKYTIDGFRNLAVQAGFRAGPTWTDAENLFSVHWLHAPAA
ncbi:L-histidine N(alpha)-methyltransferase [Amantichitinum ursilacus]|uniref:Histidine-specific methyltransferase EgtD n=1 Tax=Amantichitinum ursilacus TaxID=857265 RepID=A0A0N0GLU6_9NEIS|nr:L-histidine N(alpha)-methyltransferase [Amantichitinum ursilacus]KPC50251.1 Histidine-specific methyltransferase EgtD [Amantichitinum ursilacus]